ncbi:actin-domain-containing protein [Irpex rosettiformis]|uniref:Actin-domain-containing protein n=1 Tax=Irpex rosettiformis TaxID=378272 RepID=A0ACB8UA27_9APHY|nr:actin-domain-containing protein [Irpex rosettiformis]
MSVPPSTPRRHATYDTTTPIATPQASRAHSSSHIVQASPHYTTTRRHSLYGTEDRIILDPGSHIWKVGFSGEGKPREVSYADKDTGSPLWTLNRAPDLIDREEEDRLLEARLQTSLRAVFHDSLLTDPKSRKIIILETPLLPLHIKDMFARILFNNLQVPSISFASSHLLALLAAGRVTGLVLDCGHLESTALPIYSSRPLFPHLRTTPLAGSRLSSHLKALLLLFGTYHPPIQSLSAPATQYAPASARATRVPEELLTDTLVEELKTRCCFVGETIDLDVRIASAAAFEEPGTPSSERAMSESGFSGTSGDEGSVDSTSQQTPTSSGFSATAPSQAPSSIGRSPASEGHLQSLANLYTRSSTATDLRIRVEPPPSQQTGTGRGTLLVPGWIRERAAEVLFEGGDVDESSVAEVILDSLLKVPVDLRKSFASGIVIVGGTAMLPGFIPRLHAELVRAISPSLMQGATTPTGKPRRPRPSTHDRYAALRPLIPYFAILNNPAPPSPTTSRASANAGKSPAFTPATMAWIGGSLAGVLKIGGTEVAREKWDAADAQAEPDEDDPMDPLIQTPKPTGWSILPDWTRSPLPNGAPSAKAGPITQPVLNVVVSSPPQATAVGA